MLNGAIKVFSSIPGDLATFNMLKPNFLSQIAISKIYRKTTQLDEQDESDPNKEAKLHFGSPPKRLFVFI